MKKKTFAWIILIILILILLGYLSFVVSGISGQVVNALKEFYG